jgi:23S rRNA (guanosine2251-2'-O)-methyltransferase
MKKIKFVLIVHDVRSTHNVGSLLRTADGFGAKKVYITGYSPFPKMHNDPRLPHMAEKIDRQIRKTALGAEKTTAWYHYEKIEHVIAQLKTAGYKIAALEQSNKAQNLSGYTSNKNVALIVGN